MALLRLLQWEGVCKGVHQHGTLLRLAAFRFHLTTQVIDLDASS